MDKVTSKWFCQPARSCRFVRYFLAITYTPMSARANMNRIAATILAILGNRAHFFPQSESLSDEHPAPDCGAGVSEYRKTTVFEPRAAADDCSDVPDSWDKVPDGKSPHSMPVEPSPPFAEMILGYPDLLPVTTEKSQSSIFPNGVADGNPTTTTQECRQICRYGVKRPAENQIPRQGEERFIRNRESDDSQHQIRSTMIAA